MEALYKAITQSGRKYGAERIVLYGSRARGDHRPQSDIDLAVFGMAPGNEALFREAIDELPTLLSIDLVFVSDVTDPALIKNIEKDGVTLMNKAAEKHSRLCDAVARLKDALVEYEKFPSDVMRDGVIQRFEFSCELSWKAAREYLIEEGYADINSPKGTMKQAFADGLISDGDAWVVLLNDRNSTSHIYDDATAAQVFERIRGSHVTLMDELCKKLAR